MAEAQKVPQKQAQKAPQKKVRSGGFTGMLWWVFAAVGLFYALTDRREHFWDYVPYIMLMACPLLDIFRRFSGHRRGDLVQSGGDMTPTATKKK